MTTILKVKGREYKVELAQDKDRIVFVKSPFALKNEIKAMAGAKWDPAGRRWTVKRCPRNLFQLRFLMGENTYEHFEQDLVEIDYTRPLEDHQVDAIRRCVTYHYQIVAAEPGLGKSLVSIEVSERLGGPVWFVGPRSALESVQLELVKWGGPEMELMTYERLMSLDKDQEPPRLLFLDESTSVKTPGAARTKAAQYWADKIREVYVLDGGVFLLSGTPTAKRPSDVWSQAEIAWPGFLREGSLRAFEDRYAITQESEDANGVRFKKLIGWKDSEVSRLPARLDGLMMVYRRGSVIELPPRTFQTVTCPVTGKTKRIAKAIAEAAPNVITALTRLRALSSGFQYDDVGDTVETKCPKDDELIRLLGEEADRGRIIIGASFRGSIDRVDRICREQGWSVVRVDGRGWTAFDVDGNALEGHALAHWYDRPGKVAFVANPGSARFGITLLAAKTVVVYDQNFSAEHRLQFLDRNYRIGQFEPVRVIDLIHLPVDQLILETLNDNRRLELLSLGAVLETLDD